MSIDNPPQSEMKKYLFWRITYVGLSLGMIISVFLLYYFVQTNIIKTISNTQSIQTLSIAQNIDIIDMEAYNAAKLVMKDKQATASVPANIRNVFLSAPTSTLLNFNSNGTSKPKN
ncbi:hypothetical protein KKA13_03300 [Patescibacteria group bacterium]|nr:hypothetical protein [Patescibacteria group bacterium]MBU1613151.1 hypothetical protein [Patescibacteria group bacterium]